jgi:hypothetical protein
MAGLASQSLPTLVLLPPAVFGRDEGKFCAPFGIYARPFHEFLEKVAVNGLEVRGIEIAAWTQARADFTVASRD